ncbi:MAG TPA: type II CAAX endopeptidase family protein [Lachnospiraceae bacterium]|nr:type II CAAX endopeptidase family protein [Lachnospiraceae bacterium]
MSKFLQPDKDFQKEVTKYHKSDAISAILLFFIMCILYTVLAITDHKIPFIKKYTQTENALLVGGIFNILMIAITFLFLKVRKEKLSSIGLYNGQWKKSCIIGLILAAILFFTNCLSNIISGASFVAGKDILRLSFYYLTVAFCEEAVFRGYIGTRLYGMSSNKYMVIIVTGILFVVMHFPYRMVAYGMTISDLTIHNVGWIVDLFVTHTVLSIIYMKTNSLYGSIIPHWMSNLAYNLVMR